MFKNLNDWDGTYTTLIRKMVENGYISGPKVEAALKLVGATDKDGNPNIYKLGQMDKEQLQILYNELFGEV